MNHITAVPNRRMSLDLRYINGLDIKQRKNWLMSEINGSCRQLDRIKGETPAQTIIRHYPHFSEKTQLGLKMSTLQILADCSGGEIRWRGKPVVELLSLIRELNVAEAKRILIPFVSSSTALMGIDEQYHRPVIQTIIALTEAKDRGFWKKLACYAPQYRDLSFQALYQINPRYAFMFFRQLDQKDMEANILIENVTTFRRELNSNLWNPDIQRLLSNNA